MCSCKMFPMSEKMRKVKKHVPLDPKLYLHYCRLYFAEKPMRDWHLNFLEDTHTRKLNIQQQASLANKGFALRINSIFANLSADPVLERLRLQQKPLTDSEVQQQVDDAKHFLNLC